MRATTFIFGPYRADWQEGKLEFNYTVEFSDAEPLKFTERIELPEPTLRPGSEIEIILQNLSLILGISYYKLYVPPKIQLTHSITKKQTEFWNTVYRKGLGEFWYQNNLDPVMFPGFPTSELSRGWPGGIPTRGRIAEAPTKTIQDDGEVLFEPQGRKAAAGTGPANDRALVGIGGGKDSIVVAKLLKQEGIDLTAFAVETERGSKIVDDVIETLGIPALRIKRFLDQKLFEKHPQSFNGHVPVSAVYAWLGVLVASLQNFRWVVVGNEYSSDFGNLEYKGETINHQWSKSSEFEGLFQKYVRQYISPDVQYFSLLRPFHEIRVTEELTHLPIWKKVKNCFSSCNRNFVHHSREHEAPAQGKLWCGECPKCAFVFAMLAAFVPKKELIGIFGKNLFADERLFPLYNDLLGWGTMKPFDCVGTFEETQAAFVMAARYGYKKEPAIRHFLPKIIFDNNDKRAPMGEVRVRQLLRAQRAETVPHRFRFVGMKNALILGYGREGKVTEMFLKKFYPHIAIGVADQKDDPNYLAKQAVSDIAIKTPGIPRNKITIQYTTATNIFFSRVSNIAIGITGSKGKSTTASLIYEMLRAAGKNAALLGNIGTPMLSALLSPIPSDQIFVLELSSQQLEDIAFSPAVVVVTNLFPEHMDYHGSVKAYYDAKKNIIRFQKPGDIFIYDNDHSQLAEWASLRQAQGKQSIPFTDTLSVPTEKIPLLGRHNVRNIQAAVTVARYFGVPENAITKVIIRFKGLPHRLELVGEFRGLRFYDDAISTAPESTIAAIRSISKIGTIFLGGKDRGYDFAELAREVTQAGIQNIVLFPDSGQRVKPLLPPAAQILETSSMEEGVKFAYERSKPGEAVLLSTASPSYSLWANFEEQGNEFQKWAKALS